MANIPKARELLEEALNKLNKKNFDVNLLHQETYELMNYYKNEYYDRELSEFLKTSDFPEDIKDKIKNVLLKPRTVGDKKYSNFMEEVARRISQSFQPIAGNLAELCAEQELIKYNLYEGKDYSRKKEHTDLIIYYKGNKNICHKVEVKNVSLRERTTRGLLFDGDSIFGFFNQPTEFTEENVKILNKITKDRNGYCYVPPYIYDSIKYQKDRFRENTKFGRDMASFVKNGFI